MPRGKKKKAGKIPPWGRSESEIRAEMELETYSPNVPLGNNNPTIVQGVIYGGMPNDPRMARGRLRTERGKHN